MSTRRLAPLDGLRGVAAIAVVLAHFLAIAPAEYPGLGPSYEPFRHGAQGVQLFFVISGFVIMMSLRRGSVRDFVSSRVARLFPSYWVAILLTCGVLLVAPLPGYDITVVEALVNLTMVQTYVGVQDVDGVYWTLAIELAFYVQCAVLWRFGALRGRALMPTLYIWLGVALAVTLALPGEPQDDTVPLWAHDLFQIFTYIPWFIAGILALLIYEGRRGLPVWGLAVCLQVAMVVLDMQKNAGLLGVVYMVVILVVLLWRPLGTSSKPLLFLGEISYALYLVHQVIGTSLLLLLAEAGVPRFVAVVVVLAIVVAAATAITRWVDAPLRSPIRRYLAGQRIARDPEAVQSSGM